MDNKENSLAPLFMVKDEDGMPTQFMIVSGGGMYQVIVLHDDGEVADLGYFQMGHTQIEAVRGLMAAGAEIGGPEDSVTACRLLRCTKEGIENYDDYPAHRVCTAKNEGSVLVTLASLS